MRTDMFKTRNGYLTSLYPAGILAAAVLIFFNGILLSDVKMTPEKMFTIKFPGSAIQKKPVYIKKEDRIVLEKKAGVTFTKGFFTFHEAKKQGKIIGYAFFDTHTVRTKEETICVLFSPDGKITGVELISFYEPEEYAPSIRWLSQFVNKNDPENLRAGGNIAAMSGATLTTQSIVQTVRKALVLYKYGFMEN